MDHLESPVLEGGLPLPKPKTCLFSFHYKMIKEFNEFLEKHPLTRHAIDT